LPMVDATAVPNRNGPANSASDASNSAARGVIDREEMAAATRPLESCKPFRNAYKRIAAMTARSMVWVVRNLPLRSEGTLFYRKVRKNAKRARLVIVHISVGQAARPMALRFDHCPSGRLKSCNQGTKPASAG
jgi:hypothetical protein